MSNPNPPNQFQKGNRTALGNDKTQRISTWIEKELDKEMTPDLKGYEEGMKLRQAIARKLVHRAATLGADTALPYIKEVLDRTEGRAMQPIDHTSGGERIMSNLTDEQLAAIALEGATRTGGVSGD